MGGRAGYFASLELASTLATLKTRGELPVTPLEDVSMSFWVELAKTKYQLPVKILNNNNVHYLTEQCTGSSLIVHYVAPNAQRCAWKRVSESSTWGGLFTEPNVCLCDGTSTSNQSSLRF